MKGCNKTTIRIIFNIIWKVFLAMVIGYAVYRESGIVTAIAISVFYLERTLTEYFLKEISSLQKDLREYFERLARRFGVD